MAIADMRREYNLAGLRRTDLEDDPIAQFQKWFEQAAGKRAGGGLRRFFIRVYKCLLLVTGTEPTDLNAAALATADKTGRPSGRMVLLKGVDDRGFVFFTNYESRKGQDLAENPQAALTFYWADLERQVCISGAVTQLPREESEAYFKSRPRGSRLAAWASHQSHVIAGRSVLEARYKEFQSRYPGEDIPAPPFWGGYLLSPVRVEFWQGRANRLHDRFVYLKQPDHTWRIDRLAP